LVIFMKC